MDLSERASYLQIFMYHFNANQKASTNKKSLYNQMDKMNCPTDNLPFFLTTFVLICNGPSGLGGRDGSNAWAHNMDFVSI